MDDSHDALCDANDSAQDELPEIVVFADSHPRSCVVGTADVPPNLRVHVPADTVADEVASDVGSPVDRAAGPSGRAVSHVGPTVIAKNKVPLSALAATNDALLVDDRLRASMTVDRFVWPAVCVRWEQVAASHVRQSVSWLAAKMAGAHAVVLVTSCRHGEGRSSMAMMLAHLAAGRGLACVLVDADVRNPGIARQLNVDPLIGWGEALDGSASLADAIVQSREESVALLPLLSRVERFERLADNVKLGVHLRMLREEHDLVILDAGPLEETGQTTFIKSLTDAGHVNGVLFVRDVRRTSAEEVDSLGQCLLAASIPLWGVIENFVAAA